MEMELTKEELEKKKRKLKDIEVEFVSLVKRPATGKKFFLFKSRDGETEIYKTHKALVSFTKGEEAKQLLYGVVYSPDEVDKQGDFMDANLIEKVAHDYMVNHRNIDYEHNFESGAGYVVESYIALNDMQFGEEQVTKGSWVLVVKATKELWDEFNKGNITGFSLAGRIFDSEFIMTPDEEAELDRGTFFWSMQPKDETKKTDNQNTDEEVDMEELKKLQEQVESLAKSIEEIKSTLITDETLQKSVENKVDAETLTAQITEAVNSLKDEILKGLDESIDNKIKELDEKITKNDNPGDSKDEADQIKVIKTSFKVEDK